MDALLQYILTIISATIICMIVLSFTDKKSAMYTIIKFLSGIFLIITLITPFRDKDLMDFSDIFSRFESDSDVYVQMGEDYARQEKEVFIKEQVTAYILDRAKAMDVDIEIEVCLKEDLSGPEVIYIAGNISPYKKEQLQSLITSDLGITKENQIWQ